MLVSQVPRIAKPADLRTFRQVAMFGIPVAFVAAVRMDLAKAR
jgi:hypothetical protein